MDRRDPGGELIDAVGLVGRILRAIVEQPVQIAARAEEAIGAGEHDRANPGIPFGGGERFDAGRVHVGMQRIARAGVG